MKKNNLIKSLKDYRYVEDLQEIVEEVQNILDGQNTKKMMRLNYLMAEY